MKNKIDWFYWIVYGAGIGVMLLIIALCATSMKVYSLSHENELLVAQKETLEVNIGNRLDYLTCDKIEIADPDLERHVEIMRRMLDNGYEFDRYEFYMKPTVSLGLPVESQDD
jgi:hypothetical protein